MATLQIDVPDQLYAPLSQFVNDGWAKNAEDTVMESLRRFLDSHRPALTAEQVMEDVAWGLHGTE